jgi:hypothetical protein
MLGSCAIGVVVVGGGGDLFGCLVGSAHLPPISVVDVIAQAGQQKGIIVASLIIRLFPFYRRVE